MRRAIYTLENELAGLRVSSERQRVEVLVQVAGLELAAKLSVEQAAELGRRLVAEHADGLRRVAARDRLRLVEIES